MAMTNKNLMKRKANAVNPKTVTVGDRVMWGKTIGTVVEVSKVSRKHGFGSIMWDGDDEPTESSMAGWHMLQRA